MKCRKMSVFIIISLFLLMSVSFASAYFVGEPELMPRTLYEGGTAKLSIITSGRANAMIENTDATKHISFSSRYIIAGESETIEFTIEANNVQEDFSGSFDVILEGTTGQSFTKTVYYNIRDKDKIPESDKTYLIIRAVDKNGNLLGQNYPIYVSQTDYLAYGEWKGVVIKDNIYISGKETNGLFPQDGIVSATEYGQVYPLIYTTKEDISSTPVHYDMIDKIEDSSSSSNSIGGFSGFLLSLIIGTIVRKR